MTKLGKLGTNWALPSLEGLNPSDITTYKTGHYFQGEKEAEKKLSTHLGELGKLGTDWALPRFEGLSPSDTTTYKTGHHFQGEKEAKIKSGELICAYQEYQKAQGQRSTRKTPYELKPLMEWLEDRGLGVETLTPGGAEDYQTHLATWEKDGGMRYTTKSVSGMITSAYGFYQWLKYTAQVPNNPFYRMKRIKQEGRLPRDVPSVAEMAEGLERLRSFPQGKDLKDRRRLYRLHVIAEVLYASGLRLSELAALTESDVDWEKGTLRVREGKGGRERVAFLGDYSLKVLRIYIQRMREVLVLGDSETLWGCRNGKSLESSLNAGLRKELGWTSHTFRHALGTHLLARGCDLRMIQMILGHEDLKSTALYTRVSKEDLRSQLDTYHPRGG